MTAETVFTNARIVLGDRMVRGALMVRDGVIGDIATTAGTVPGEDLAGDYLIPGLVELHTDNLEGQAVPRPGVEWPAVPALLAHDAMIAAAGITTVLDALRAGSFEAQGAIDPQPLAAALAEAKGRGLLRADHLIHLRCELPCPDTIAAAEALAGDPNLKLISVMDHTPGERQFVTVQKFRDYYLGKKIMGAEQLELFISERREFRDSHSAKNRTAIVALARRLGVTLASHDDATLLHVEEAIAEGVTIAEFPTTAEAAAAAHMAGLSVLMGAPNLIRGGSHSGNISTAAVAANGHLDALSSDYVPGSLLAAAFALPDEAKGIELPAAIATVTRAPAAAVGLDDRGEIAVGKRADLVQVNADHGWPVVRRVWREGRRVL
ncbi:MAG: alpha-D-ribose 1-methylphosphonate 5-triphosphate diphosphatase [Aestuariivirgaceae bacterium]